MCWHGPVNPALEREKQEDPEPKDIFQYTVSSRLAGDLVSTKDLKEIKLLFSGKWKGLEFIVWCEIRQILHVSLTCSI